MGGGGRPPEDTVRSPLASLRQGQRSDPPCGGHGRESAVQGELEAESVPTVGVPQDGAGAPVVGLQGHSLLPGVPGVVNVNSSFVLPRENRNITQLLSVGVWT